MRVDLTPTDLWGFQIVLRPFLLGTTFACLVSFSFAFLVFVLFWYRYVLERNEHWPLLSGDRTLVDMPFKVKFRCPRSTMLQASSTREAARGSYVRGSHAHRSLRTSDRSSVIFSGGNHLRVVPFRRWFLFCWFIRFFEEAEVRCSSTPSFGDLNRRSWRGLS